MRSKARIVATIAFAVAAALFALHVAATTAYLTRAPHHDEVETLHAAWLSSQGLQIFRDYHEHHPTLMHELAKAFIPSDTSPAFPRLDVVTFTVRLRVLVGILGLLGVLGVAAVSYRISRSVVAPVVVIASLLGSDLVWLRGVAEIRIEPIALMMMWLATLLLLFYRKGGLRGAVGLGAGLGLLGVGVVCCPKWPFVTVVIGLAALAGLVRLWRERRALVLVAAAIALPMVAVTLVVMFREAHFADYWVHVVQFNSANAKYWMKVSYLADPNLATPFYFCSWPFSGWMPVLLVGVVVVGLAWRRVAILWGVDRRAGLWALALFAAAALELRFVFAYPRLWPQYYLMWSYTLAVVYGCAAGAFAALAASLLRPRLYPVLLLAVESVACLFWVAYDWEYFYTHPGTTPAHVWHWRSMSYLQRELRPGEHVWLHATYHPVAALDDSYYWFVFIDVVPSAMEFAKTHPGFFPPLGEQDLPPCRLAEGRAPNLRFLTAFEEGFVNTPTLQRCMQQLREKELLCRTPLKFIYEVRAKHAGNDCIPVTTRPGSTLPL